MKSALYEAAVGRKWPLKHAGIAVDLRPFNWTRWGARRVRGGLYISFGPLSVTLFGWSTGE